MDIEKFFQDTLETRIERLEKKNKENESNILRMLKHLKIDDKEITKLEQIKTKNVNVEERIKYLEKRDIIIEKALLGIIERL